MNSTESQLPPAPPITEVFCFPNFRTPSPSRPRAPQPPSASLPSCLSATPSLPEPALAFGGGDGPRGNSELPPQGLARVGRCLSLGVSVWAVQSRQMSRREPDSSCHHGRVQGAGIHWGGLRGWHVGQNVCHHRGDRRRDPATAPGPFRQRVHSGRCECGVGLGGAAEEGAGETVL